MKPKNVRMGLALAVILLADVSTILAQGTAFTYQGRLTASSVPQDGSYDLTFSLYDAALGGNVLGAPVTASAVTVINGVFAVVLDFGGGVFDGRPRWLEIGVRPTNLGNFTTLSPRQALTASPYAFFAASPQGPPGAPGSVWRQGSGVPSNSTGIDGDFYLDGDAGNVYQRVLGSYNILCNIKGQNGTSGTNGAAGTPGSIWREGSAAPATTLGVDGDFYLNGATGDVYLRASGAYSPVANIKGSPGPAGVAIPFHGFGSTNIPLFEVDNSSSGNGVSGMTGTGYGIFGQANNAGGWGGLFRYGSDGNNSAYLGTSGSAGIFYGPVSVNGATSGTLFEANNGGSGGQGVAVRGDSPGCGAYGELGAGVFAVDTTTCYGVYGNGGIGGYAGQFDGSVNINGALSASTSSGNGVYGFSSTGNGVYGYSSSGDGVYASSSSGYAGDFAGKVRALGTTTGDWNAALVRFENQNSSSGSSPALRVVANGDAPNGALSVSAQGTGLIAQFGNASSFVARLDANGNWYAVTMNPTSDRNLKENLHDISPAEVLEKVVQLHISRWNFKSEAATQHIGPMAQDFYSAFGVGSDDKHIATVDADGVALAAIQALNDKIEQKDSEIQTLKQRLEAMERLLNRVAAVSSEK